MQLTKTATNQQPDAIRLHTPLSKILAVNVFKSTELTPYGCVSVCFKEFM